MCPLGSVWVEAGHFSRRRLLSLRHLIGRNTHRDKKWESIPATAARIPIWVISVSCHYIYRSARCSHDFDPILKIPPFMHLVIGPPTHLFIHLITSNICGAAGSAKIPLWALWVEPWSRGGGETFAPSNLRSGGDKQPNKWTRRFVRR